MRGFATLTVSGAKTEDELRGTQLRITFEAYGKARLNSGSRSSNQRAQTKGKHHDHQDWR